MKLRYLLVIGALCVGAIGAGMVHAGEMDTSNPNSVPQAPASAAAEEPPPTQAQFDAGKQLFSNRCARCHGWNMVNLGSFSFDLRKFPHNDRARFFNSVMNGKNAMPVWKDVLTKEDIENVWAYVRTGGKM